MAHSPIIDRADSTYAPATDITGFGRVDDPGMPNLGIGLADIGAYEFRGDSNDAIVPTIAGIAPTFIHAGTNGQFGVTTITIEFSELMNFIDARAVANYELRGRGGDGIFGTDDDVIYALTPSYDDRTVFVTLDIVAGPLPMGIYRFTIKAASMHDLAGLQLDGDANGSAGGNYVRTFESWSTRRRRPLRVRRSSMTPITGGRDHVQRGCFWKSRTLGPGASEPDHRADHPARRSP